LVSTDGSLNLRQSLIPTVPTNQKWDDVFTGEEVLEVRGGFGGTGGDVVEVVADGVELLKDEGAVELVTFWFGVVITGVDVGGNM
jgi:hypothetical protein